METLSLCMFFHVTVSIPYFSHRNYYPLMTPHRVLIGEKKGKREFMKAAVLASFSLL